MSGPSTEDRMVGAPRRQAGQVAVVVSAVLAHPTIWWAAVTALVRLSRRGWWHRSPFLPLPGEDYWRFRLVTAFGDTGRESPMERHDVVAYLRWCRRTHPGRG